MKLRNIVAAATLAGLTIGCTTTSSEVEVADKQAMKTTISGEVYYRPRIALPPGAELSVVLLDTSLNNPLGNLFAGTNIALDGKNVPVPFSFVADQSMMIPGDTYEVRALIRSKAGDIIWRTKTGHIVDLSSSAYDAGQIELVMVESSESPDSSALQGAAWAVEDINGGGVIDNSKATVTFGENGRISGSGGCNMFSGRYEATGKTLKVMSDIVMTRKACAPALMQQDQRLMTILQSAQHYWIKSGALTILSKNGRSLTARRD